MISELIWIQCFSEDCSMCSFRWSYWRNISFLQLLLVYKPLLITGNSVSIKKIKCCVWLILLCLIQYLRLIYIELKLFIWLFQLLMMNRSLQFKRKACLYVPCLHEFNEQSKYFVLIKFGYKCQSKGNRKQNLCKCNLILNTNTVQNTELVNYIQKLIVYRIIVNVQCSYLDQIHPVNKWRCFNAHPAGGCSRFILSVQSSLDPPGGNIHVIIL